MVVLGIETTCDETAAAVVERHDDGPGKILSNIVLSQVNEHAAFGGVVPEIAARAHVEALDRIIAKAMSDAGKTFATIDGVAAAAGPGLIGGVIVGLTTAKAIALVAAKPLIAVNHLEAHALTARLTDAVPFPYCLFLASGGHTQVVAVRGVGQYSRIGTTIDDAIGEAFDKTAKLLGLGYPGGLQVEKEAERGNPVRFALPRPMFGPAGSQLLAFSGLKTALRLEAEKISAADRSGRRRPLRLVSSRPWSRPCSTVAARRPARIFRERLRRAERAGRGRRRRLEPGDPQGAAPHLVRERHRARWRAAAGALHRQRRDDRMGRHAERLAHGLTWTRSTLRRARDGRSKRSPGRAAPTPTS